MTASLRGIRIEHEKEKRKVKSETCNVDQSSQQQPETGRISSLLLKFQ